MDKDKFFERLLIFAWIFMLFICLALLSFTSHAASDQDYFPMFQNNNGFFSDFDKTSIENYFDSENNYVFAYFAGYQAGYGSRMKNFYVLKIPKNSGITIYGEKYTNLQQFSLYAVGGSFSNSDVTFYQILDQGWTYQYSANLSVFTGMYSSNYSNSVDYVSNFKIMTNGTSSAQVVLFYDDGVTIPDGDTAREDMDKPDIDDYIPSWSNKPSFDNSSVEAALSSIFDITSWVGENIRETIKGLGDFIGDTFRWVGQKIINSIRDKIDELKAGIVEALGPINALVNDIKGFVSSIKTEIEYITEPVDSDLIYDTYSGTSFASDIGSIQTNFTSFVGQFNDITEPNTYKIPIHFENITIFHDVGVQYIDLGWINSVKSVLRAFLWCITTYGLIAAIFDAIPKYINGGGDEGD